MTMHYKINVPKTVLCEQTLNEKDATTFAKQAIQEGYSIWEEPSDNWETMYSATTVTSPSMVQNLTVESRRITEGPYSTSNILLTRASGIIPNTISPLSPPLENKPYRFEISSSKIGTGRNGGRSGA